MLGNHRYSGEGDSSLKVQDLIKNFTLDKIKILFNIEG